MRACCFGMFSMIMGLVVPFSTGVVVVGVLRVAPLICAAILVVPGPWLVNEGMGAEGALTGRVALIGCSPESGLIGA
jgi:hypothetical protein